MERPKPQITWHESPPRPPFNGDLFVDDLPQDPELDQAIHQIVLDDLEGEVATTAGEFELSIMAELHEDGEPIWLQGGTPRPTFYHRRQPDEIQLTPYEEQALRDAQYGGVATGIINSITPERFDELAESHASGEPLAEE